MRVLVTGAAGFVGTNVCLRLLEMGHKVVALDDLSAGSFFLPKSSRLTFLKEDVTHERTVNHAMRGIDSVVHAACVQMPTSLLDAQRDLAVHVRGTLNVAQNLRGRRMVYLSSCSVYGQQTILPILENAPLYPFTVYAAGKLGGESYVRALGANAVCLRLSNVYGPYQHPAYHASVVGRFIFSAEAGETANIHGDGLAVRDFTYVDDVVDAIVLSLESEKQGVFNVATGRGTSIKSLADICGVKTKHVPLRSLDTVSNRILSNTLIDIELGWKPKTPLSDGIEKTRAWVREIREAVTA